MREGLRSQSRLGKPEKDQLSGAGVVRKNGDYIKQKAVDLDGKNLLHEREALNLTIEKKGVQPVAVKEECDLDRDMDTRSNAGLAKNRSKRRRLSFGNNIKDANIEGKVNKDEGSNEKAQICGRVLRSRFKRGYGKTSDNGDRDRFKKKKVKLEKEEADEFVGNGYEKEMVESNREVNDKRVSKRKRGRPFKVKMKGEDQLVGVFQRKRGRPPNATRNNNVLKVAHNEKGKVGFQEGKKGLFLSDGANPSVPENNEMASQSKSNSVSIPVPEKNVKSKAKQLVREQIWRLLSAAGWTVDYRPRNGKLYNDAVYVSLDGKTHWSITLAYNRLKRHCEACDGEGMVYVPGFKFTPIPEEEFNILTKVMNKTIKGKEILKQEGEKSGNKVDDDVVNKNVKKEKLGSGGGLGKSMKKKVKRKGPLLEEDNGTVTSLKRVPVLVKAHKRQKTQSKKRFAFLARNAEKDIDSEVDEHVPYNGKRTVLAWMIDLGTVQQNGKVLYINERRKSVALEGRITRDGIHCNCCNETVTILKFKDHARSKLRDPLQHIYIEEGTSLLQCLLDSWNKQDEPELKSFHFIDVAGEDPNDDTCGVCGDGGDLICCDGCPSTFHRSCLDIQKFPSGDWHCIYCCCKFCGLVGGSTNAWDSNDDFVTASALVTCHLCKQKYHRSCLKANGAKTDDSSDAFFCGNRCKELSKRLEMLLGAKHDIGDGFSCTFIRRSDVGLDASLIKPEMVECNSKLAVASLIMDECFMPYIDRRSGINLIHSVLYNSGSNFNRLNYSGFFTAILERGDEIISAASIRIHGNYLAEMPFIGTCSMYRRQGMCRRLLSAIELALSSLNVELLVIPAISELRETWTSVFGFAPLDVTRKQRIKNMNLLVIPHVDMLHKTMLKHHFIDGNVIPAEVSNPQPQKNQMMHELANNVHDAHSCGSDLIISAGVSSSNACQMGDKPMTFYSNYSLLNKTLNITSENMHSEEARQFLTVSHTSTKATEGGCVSASSQGAKNIHNEVKVADEIVISDNNAEDSQCQMAVRTPLKAEIVFCTRSSKDSVDNICHYSKSTIPCTDRLETLHQDSQTLQLAEPIFGSCRISDTSEGTSSHDCVAESNSLPANKDVVPDNKPWLNQSSELPEPVSQITRSSVPSLCSPNTASGVAFHCTSVGGPSCSSAEVLVLSNQAS